MRIGVLTAGGDCPGLNAVLRAVVRRALGGGDEVLGIQHGYGGLERGEVEGLTRNHVSGILARGGTIIGTSRANPFATPEGLARCLANVRRYQLDALVAVGGDGTLRGALALHGAGVPVVGVPKTIDNDVPGTDQSFGFDTAVAIATEAIDRLHTTAEAHDRAMVVEVMGRHAGWIAVAAGIAGGADWILVPERPADLDAVCAMIEQRRRGGRAYHIVVVAEGARLDLKARPVPPEGPAERCAGPGRVGDVVSRAIADRTGIETRVTVLGHVQRGGSPTAFDRILATRFGVAAVDAVRAGRTGCLTALRGTAIVPVPLAEALQGARALPPDWWDVASAFFG